MQADNNAQERSPKHHGDTAEDAVAGGSKRRAQGNLQQTRSRQRQPVELAQPDMALVASEVRSIAAKQRCLGVHGAPGDDPSGMRPEGAVDRGMWIAFLIGVLMVNTMGGHPEDGSTFKRQR